METFSEMNSLFKKHESSYVQHLLLTLPTNYIQLGDTQDQYEQIIMAFQEVSQATEMDEDLGNFFKELSIEK